MTKTQTARLRQNQYSSGSDSFRRVDYNADGAFVEARAAYDDGLTYTTLPDVADIIAGRYVMYSSGAGAYRSLYRATETNGAWESALGSAIPAPLIFRPHAAADFTATATALSFGHPDLAAPPGKITFDGQASFPRVTAYDPNDIARGSVYVGTNTAHDPTALGRMHVRTRVNGERGLMLQPHSVDAGNLFTVREAGGSDVVTVDASGYLRARSLSGFGGGAINPGAAVVAAPTSASGDGVDIGMLLHGQSTATAKTILSVRRDLADTAPVLNVARDAIQVGRLPWGDGTSGGGLTMQGRQLLQRAVGYDADPLLWRLNRASTSSPGDTGLDETTVSFSRSSGLVRVPMTMTQALGTSAANLTLKHYTDFGSRFVELHRMSGETSEVLSSWDADGRLALGARWISNGTMRDARQILRHCSMKQWAVPGVDGYQTGPKIDISGPTQSFTYTFGTMQTRSNTGCDLTIFMESEYCLENESDDFGSACLYDIYVSINGGTFDLITTREYWAVAVPAGDRPVGQTPHFITNCDSLPAGATFQVRVRVRNNGSAFSAPMYLRMIYLNIEESIVTAYTAP